jgi:hypothetical protein
VCLVPAPKRAHAIYVRLAFAIPLSVALVRQRALSPLVSI